MNSSDNKTKNPESPVATTDSSYITPPKKTHVQTPGAPVKNKNRGEKSSPSGSNIRPVRLFDSPDEK